MTELYLVFQTESAAQIALETIYSNMVEFVSSPDLLDVTQQRIFDKDELTPEEAVQFGVEKRRFPVFGINAATGEKNVDNGYTTSWGIPKKTISGFWVYPKPKDELMGGVTGYTVEPYDPIWFPQEEQGNGVQ